jgi:hypothetical protein
MFTKLTEPPTLTGRAVTDPSHRQTLACRAEADSSRRRAPDRHDHKSLISNHPHRYAIAFLIDTPTIRNGPNSFRTNETFISNRYKIGLFNVPYDGAGEQPISLPGATGQYGHNFEISTRNTLGNRNRLNIPAINDINFSTRNKTGGGQPKLGPISRVTSHGSLATRHSPLVTARVNQPSRSNRSVTLGKPGSVWRMISLIADLKGSSEGMRASQR